MPAIEMICLANSIKLGGRCVAGLKTDGTGWVRPVSNRLERELTSMHYRLTNGTPVNLLDLVRLKLAEEKPLPHQPENVLIEKEPWELIVGLHHCDIL